jgi:hypothetical protein
VDVHLERVCHGRRRPLAPERVDQRVARDGFARGQDQAREQLGLPARSDRDDAAVVDDP